MCMVIFAPIFAVCAFATCGGYYGHLQVKVDCAERRPSNRSINIDFSYPFSFSEQHVRCSGRLECSTQGEYLAGRIGYWYCACFGLEEKPEHLKKTYSDTGKTCKLHTLHRDLLIMRRECGLCCVYRLQQVHFRAPLCEARRHEVYFLDGDMSLAAQFFVMVGVFAFLYSLLATVVYVFYQNTYLRNNRGPLVDFVVTVVFSFMWLVCTCCWAKALSDLKSEINPSQVLRLISACRAPENKCTITQEPRWSRLNTSVVFGFVNLVLWAGNIWFVFKETGWYKSGQRYPTRSASGKRASEMRQRLYSESSFDQPDDFGPQPLRQDSFNQVRLDPFSQTRELQRQSSMHQAPVGLSLPQTIVSKPHERDNTVRTKGPVIFVNEI